MKDKFLCKNCVEDPHLKNIIKTTGENEVCDFCGLNAPAITLGEISKLVEEVFKKHYNMSFPEPPDYEQNGETASFAIMDAGGFPENAAEQIRQILYDHYYDFDDVAAGIAIPFDNDSFYAESAIDIGDLEWQWENFERMIKTQARFFNATGFALLESIFDGIERLTTVGKRPVIVEAGPGCYIDHLYRARVFQSPQVLKAALINPVNALGPPPSISAMAGRMNAQGISVFYGAGETDTAIAEVRPPVGSEVVVARFDIIKKLHLLDLTAFEEISLTGSLFDPIFSEKLRKLKFLRNLSNQMAIPVMPDDQAHEYLVTQAIADFLSFKNDITIDGIIYPSVQADKKAINVILFHKSSRVEQVRYPENVSLDATVRDYSDDGFEKSYTVTEEKVNLEKFKALKKLDPWGSFSPVGTISSYMDERKPTLKIDLASIAVHEIVGVSYPKNTYTVTRISIDEPDEEKGVLPF